MLVRHKVQSLLCAGPARCLHIQISSIPELTKIFLRAGVRSIFGWFDAAFNKYDADRVKERSDFYSPQSLSVFRRLELTGRRQSGC